MDIGLGWNIRSQQIYRAARGAQSSEKHVRYGYGFTPESPQSSANSKERPDGDEEPLIEQHIQRTQILLAPLLPPIPPQSLMHPNKSSTKDTRTESLLLFGVPAVEQTAQPVMDLVKPGPRFGSLLVGSTAVTR